MTERKTAKQEVEEQDRHSAKEEHKSARKSKHSKASSLTYRDIANLCEDIKATPELPPEERSINNKDEMLSCLKESVIAMVQKGYTPEVIAIFINERQSSYVVYKREIQQLLTKKEKSTFTRKRKNKTQGEQSNENAGNITKE